MVADTRYPYTYSADLIREVAAEGKSGDFYPNSLSRSEASSIRMMISSVLGMDDAEIARKLADHYLKHNVEVKSNGQSNR
jgi:hypothetical protein